MKVYITKYALTTGIMSREVEATTDSMVSHKENGSYSHYHGKDWHLTLEGAIARAEGMRNAKLAAIEKGIKKLNEIDFSKIQGE